MAKLSDDDLTSGELAPKLVAAALAHVPFDGWSDRALNQAARDIGIDPVRAQLVFPGGGHEMLFSWLDAEQAWLKRALADADLGNMKIRDRVKTAILTKIEREADHKEAARRALTVLMQPAHAGKSAKHLWQTADIMWRAAGDTATDFNHYSKRTILSGILSATMLYWLNDDSDNFASTRAFVDRRIAGVMRFEKFKAQMRKADIYRPSLARFLGRLRYPSR